MPHLFSNPPFVALGASTDHVARIAPLMVRTPEVANVPSGSEYWVWLEGETTWNEAAALLDAGAQRLISSSQSLLSQIPAHRLVLQLGDTHALDPQTLGQTSGVFCTVDALQNLGALRELRTRMGGAQSVDTFDILVAPSTAPSLATVKSLFDSKLGIVPVLSSSWLSASETGEGTGSRLDAAQLFAASLKTDRSDGLYPTVVHSTDGQSLGLVYSSVASLAHSIASPQAQATYFSRSRNALWLKGATSGAYQRVSVIRRDCDGDAVEFVVEPVIKTGIASHFCHTGRSASCFGPAPGLARLETTLLERRASAPEGSYTARLFSDRTLLDAKVREEADEVCRAEGKQDVAAEAADLLYFLLARCVSEGLSLSDVTTVLDKRADKVTRRPGHAKPQFLSKGVNGHVVEDPASTKVTGAAPALDKVQPPLSMNKDTNAEATITLPTYEVSQLDAKQRAALLKRPLVASDEMVGRVKPIIDAVRKGGDTALRSYVSTLDRCTPAQANVDWPIVLNAPFDGSLMALEDRTRAAIDRAFANIASFHQAQMDRERKVLEVETMPGVVCKRMCRPIDRVGLYIPGGTAVLPSTALMLAIPATIANCPFISIATPPLPDGSIRPEIVYIAHRCGVQQIIRAGGAHAVAALAYGTDTVGKVDKVFGPGNQWVTAAKMSVSMDSSAGVGIDMPAGPSEVLVIADSTANASFVASDLLSQAEHGPDSQVVLLAVNLPTQLLADIQQEIDKQANALPRVEVVRTCLTKSLLLQCPDLHSALDFSNAYAPEHLILHLKDAEALLPGIKNAGSVFLGAWSPESCGDYASGTNHTLPTYGYARQYSGVSTSSFLKHITTQTLTADGLKDLGPTVIRLAEVEGLEAHANAVRVRLAKLAHA